MFRNKILILSVIVSFCTSSLLANDNRIKLDELDELDGNWHLHIADGMGAQKARTILEFDSTKMTISGFDGCNKISGTLLVNPDNTMTSKLTATKMMCREKIHAYASKRLHETLAEGFTVVHARNKDVDGIMLKSEHHTLFFKRMGKGAKSSSWIPFDFNFDFNFNFGSKSESDTNDTNITPMTDPKQN
jgi:heat shock protein HslJ